VIAILGAGKMGEALLSGLLRAGVAPSAVIAAVRRDDRGALLAGSYGIEAVSALAATGLADTLVITVKPQDMPALLDEIAPQVKPDQLVISVAAGITTRFIESRLPVDVPVVRVMSNTPVLVDEAMSVISAGRFASEPHLRRTEDLLKPVGKVQRPRLRLLPGGSHGRRRNTARHAQGNGTRDGAASRVRSGDDAARVRRAPGDPARGGHLARRHHDQRDQGARTARGTGGFPFRDRGRKGPRPGAWRRLAAICPGRPGSGGAVANSPVTKQKQARARGCPFASTNYAGYGRDWCAEYSLAQTERRRGLPMAAEATPLSAVRFLTVAEVATIMRVSKMTVYRLVHSGDLEAIRVGRSFRVPERAVNQYLRDAFVEAG
jgi:excisionase family DNA binding protein